MRKETKRELAAFPITLILLGITFVILWAADAGFWAFLAVGIVVLVVLVVAAVIAMRRPRYGAAPERPGRPAGAAQPISDDLHRVLVITNDACTQNDLGEVIGLGGDELASVFVVAPALSSRTGRWTGDEHAYEEAAARLDATLRALKDLGVEAGGHIGAHDPLQAADDGLREFAADEIVFATHAEDEATWLEQGIVDAARARYAMPVKEVTFLGRSRTA